MRYIEMFLAGDKELGVWKNVIGDGRMRPQLPFALGYVLQFVDGSRSEHHPVVPGKCLIGCDAAVIDRRQRVPDAGWRSDRFRRRCRWQASSSFSFASRMRQTRTAGRNSSRRVRDRARKDNRRSQMPDPVFVLSQMIPYFSVTGSEIRRGLRDRTRQNSPSSEGRPTFRRDRMSRRERTGEAQRVAAFLIDETGAAVPAGVQKRPHLAVVASRENEWRTRRILCDE